MKYYLIVLFIGISVLIFLNIYKSEKFSSDYKGKAMLLNESNFDQETSKGLVLVDFYADWCGPCKALAPVLDELQNVKVGKVNIDVDANLANKYNVYCIPKLIFFKDGVEVGEISGLQSKEVIQDKVDELNAN